MLTPAKIQAISDPIEEVYIHIVDELMVNIGKHLTSPTWTHTAAWEIQKLSEMGQLTQENAEIINKWIKQLPKEVRDAMEETRRLALEKIEKDMEKAVRLGKLPEPLADSTVNVLNEYSQQAIDQLNLVNTVMLQSSVQQYQRAVQLTKEEYDKLMQQQEQTQIILNEAAGSVATGIETREKALRRAITRISDEGLTGFIDRAGHHWSPEAYVNMDIRTTVHNTAIQSVKNFMTDYNTQVFQVSSHAAARPGCYPYQGKFYSWDNSAGEIELGNGNMVRYEPLNVTTYGQPAGLFGINCGHYPIPIVPGVTIPHGADNIQPKEENDKAYEESQVQRSLERQIREAKRVVEMAGDKASPEMKQKVKDAQEQMRDFIARTGRTRRYDRESLYGSAVRSQTIKEQKPQVPTFTPAKTIQDAEKYAERFVDKSRFGSVGISYQGVDVGVANRINATLERLYDKYTIDKFGGVFAPAGNTKLGKAIEGATAGYSPIRHSFLLNRKSLKSEKAFLESIAADQKAIKDYIAHPEKYDLSKARKVVATVLRNSVASGRGTVPETIEEVLYHEFGHALEKPLSKLPNILTLKERMPTYAVNISGYATTEFSEYVAESFASYMKGESKADPLMIEAFISLERS